MKTLYNYLVNPQGKKNKIIAIAIWALTGAFVTYEIYTCLRLTARFSSTLDSQLFLTVGRGITEGLSPYSGMYENKPPACFWVYALSYKICGDERAAQLLSAACTFLTGLMPMLTGFYIYKYKSNKQPVKAKAIAVISVMFGLLMWFFCDIRAGRGQVESFGALFTVLYVTVIYFTNSQKLKPYSWQVFAAALAVMTGAMFKEPFVLTAAAAALILCESKADYLYKLVLPMVYGGVMGVALLAATGCLGDYLTVYLSHMLGTHVSVYGSVWLRGLNFIYPMISTVMFGGIFEAVILLLVAFFIACIFLRFNIKSKSGKIYIALNVLKFCTALYLFCLAIGMGGQYFRHHFIFGIPFYVALFYFFANKCLSGLKIENSRVNILKLKVNAQRVISLMLVLCICSLVMVCFTANFTDSQGTWIYERPCAKAQAQYVDSVMQAVGAENYQYIGFAGSDFFYAYTNTLPLGPVFVQDSYNFTEQGWFTENLLTQLKSAQMVVYIENNTGVISEQVENILATEFTTEAPEAVNQIEMPSYFPYTIYYRIEN